MLSLVAATLALTLSHQTVREQADVAGNELSVRPTHNEILPANGRIWATDLFNDSTLTVTGTVIAPDATTETTLSRHCTEDHRSCYHGLALTDLEEGEDLTLELQPSQGLLSRVDVTVGPEDTTPPPALEIEPPHVSAYVDEGSGALLYFELTMFFSASIDNDIAMVEFVEVNDDGTQTPLGYRIVQDSQARAIQTVRSDGDEQACFAVNAYDLAGNRTTTETDALCRGLTIDDADDVFELSEEQGVALLWLPGCSHIDATTGNAPVGLAALLGLGLCWGRSRRRRD